MAIVAAGGCQRGQPELPLIAAFSVETEVGRLRPAWHETGATRPGPNGVEREIAYRVDAHNALSDRVYLRLGGVRLLGGGAVVGRDERVRECALAPGETEAVLSGTVWVGAAPPDGIEVDRIAVPLSERGRAFYREFLIAQRPGDQAAIDAEIAAKSNVPACGG